MQCLELLKQDTDLNPLGISVIYCSHINIHTLSRHLDTSWKPFQLSLIMLNCLLTSSNKYALDIERGNTEELKHLSRVDNLRV